MKCDEYVIQTYRDFNEFNFPQSSCRKFPTEIYALIKFLTSQMIMLQENGFSVKCFQRDYRDFHLFTAPTLDTQLRNSTVKWKLLLKVFIQIFNISYFVQRTAIVANELFRAADEWKTKAPACSSMCWWWKLLRSSFLSDRKLLSVVGGIL